MPMFVKQMQIVRQELQVFLTEQLFMKLSVTAASRAQWSDGCRVCTASVAERERGVKERSVESGGLH